MIDFSLSADLLEIQARARRFAQEKVWSIAAECDRRAVVPPDIAEGAKAADLLNVTMPKDYPIEKLMRSAELPQFCGGTNQIQRMVIAR